jgi:hypothetical protein
MLFEQDATEVWIDSQSGTLRNLMNRQSMISELIVATKGQTMFDLLTERKNPIFLKHSYKACTGAE